MRGATKPLSRSRAPRIGPLTRGPKPTRGLPGKVSGATPRRSRPGTGERKGALNDPVGSVRDPRPGERRPLLNGSLGVPGKERREPRGFPVKNSETLARIPAREEHVQDAAAMSLGRGDGW